MPPANTPLESPSPAEPAGAVTPILGVRTEDEVDADNISFLRRPIDIMDGHEGRTAGQERRSLRMLGYVPLERQRSQAGDGEEDVEALRERQYLAHRDELIRQRRRSQEAFAESMRDRTATAYGDRVPNHQSLYDWAPGTQEHNETENEELLALMAEIQLVQPNTHPEIVRALARAQHDTWRNNHGYGGLGTSTGGRSSGQQDLRSAAILQSVSRNWRFSHRSRNLMSQYIIDRERALLSGDANSNGSTNPTRSRFLPDPVPETLRDSHNRSPWPGAVRPTDNTTPPPQNSGGESVTLEALRRRYLENPSTKVTEFERIIKYLHGVRLSNTGSASSSDAVDGSSSDISSTLSAEQETLRKMKHVQPHPSSWLIPGMTFEGQQQATPLQHSTMYRPANNAINNAMNSSNNNNNIDSQIIPNPRPSTLAPSEPWLGRTLTASPQPTTTPPTPPPDSWTVKVALHSIDYETMTLQGTMEAYNVPSYSSATPNSPVIRNPDSSTSKTTFSTYLTGELIDLKHHSLLTESDKRFALKTTPDIDAKYWRKLEPFSSLSDTEIAEALLDRKWVEEQLMGKYILMRWKERCFVRPTFTTFSHRDDVDESGSGSGNRSVNVHASTNTITTTSQYQPSTSTSNHQPSPSTSTSIQPDPSTTQPTSSEPRPTPIVRLPSSSTTIPQPRQQNTLSIPPPTETTSYIPGSDGQGYGLSISGFYYVSLRRSDGHCEGLYFDPQSSPYQRLSLKPMCKGLYSGGAWEVR